MLIEGARTPPRLAKNLLLQNQFPPPWNCRGIPFLAAVPRQSSRVPRAVAALLAVSLCPCLPSRGFCFRVKRSRDLG